MEKWTYIVEKFPDEHICDDGFHEPSDPVLVLMRSGKMYTSRYWSRFDKKWPDLKYPTTDEVIAWTQLPEPPADYLSFEEFKDTFTEEEQDRFIDYLIDKEVKEWQSFLVLNNSLNIDNIREIFSYGWQWWNTYNDPAQIKMVDRNDPGCEDISFDLVDWEKVIRLAKEDDSFKYSIHQYGDYAVIDVDFTKDGIKISCLFPNENAKIHLAEDFKESIFYTESFIRAAIKAPVDAYWRQGKCNISHRNYKKIKEK